MEWSRDLENDASRIGIRMLQHINQAMASLDPQLVMSHIREAMTDGEELGQVLDAMLEIITTNIDARERIEAASDTLREVLTTGTGALTASEYNIKSKVSSMRDHINQIMTDLSSASMHSA
jgi:hypothetical protein